QGAQPHLRFDPPMLDMGPVLPDTPEGDVQEVTVLNEGTWDVEIFSLDFDKVTIAKQQYLLQQHFVVALTRI
ncbi:unnamed protein product, partial [Laminaria digitata]